jgi:hypothetical protein
MLLAGDDEVAASHPCRAVAEKGATPDVLRTVTYQGLQAFDVSKYQQRPADRPA